MLRIWVIACRTSGPLHAAHLDAVCFTSNSLHAAHPVHYMSHIWNHGPLNTCIPHIWFTACRTSRCCMLHIWSTACRTSGTLHVSHLGSGSLHTYIPDIQYKTCLTSGQLYGSHSVHYISHIWSNVWLTSDRIHTSHLAHYMSHIWFTAFLHTLHQVHHIVTSGKIHVSHLVH